MFPKLVSGRDGSKSLETKRSWQADSRHPPCERHPTSAEEDDVCSFNEGDWRSLVNADLLFQIYHSPVYLERLQNPLLCSFSHWITAVVVVDFDVHIGHKAEIEYPPGALTEQEKGRLIRIALPESRTSVSAHGNRRRRRSTSLTASTRSSVNGHNMLSGDSVTQTRGPGSTVSCEPGGPVGDPEAPHRHPVWHASNWLGIRLRRDSPLPLSRTGIKNQRFCIGAALFRSTNDSNNRRGARQQSIAIVSPLPARFFFPVLLPLTMYTANFYFARGPSAIYDMCACVGFWPFPDALQPSSVLCATPSMASFQEDLRPLTLRCTFLSRKTGYLVPSLTFNRHNTEEMKRASKQNTADTVAPQACRAPSVWTPRAVTALWPLLLPPAAPTTASSGISTSMFLPDKGSSAVATLSPRPGHRSYSNCSVLRRRFQSQPSFSFAQFQTAPSENVERKTQPAGDNVQRGDTVPSRRPETNENDDGRCLSIVSSISSLFDYTDDASSYSAYDEDNSDDASLPRVPLLLSLERQVFSNVASTDAAPIDAALQSRLGWLRGVLYQALKRCPTPVLDARPWELCQLYSIINSPDEERSREILEQDNDHPDMLGDISVVPSLCQALGPLTRCWWYFWEILILEEPFLVLARNATATSTLVLQLLELIRPLEYAADYRPYVNTFDPDLEYYRQSLLGRHGAHSHSVTTSRQASCLGIFMGGADPVLLQTMNAFPNIVVVGHRKDLCPPTTLCKTLHASSYTISGSASSTLRFGSPSGVKSDVVFQETSAPQVLKNADMAPHEDTISWLRVDRSISFCAPYIKDSHLVQNLLQIVLSSKDPGLVNATVYKELDRALLLDTEHVTRCFLRIFDIFLRPDTRPLMTNPLGDTPRPRPFTPSTFLEYLETEIDRILTLSPFLRVPRQRFISTQTFRDWFYKALQDERRTTHLTHLAYCTALRYENLKTKLTLPAVIDGCATLRHLIRECSATAPAEQIKHIRLLLAQLKERADFLMDTNFLPSPAIQAAHRDVLLPDVEQDDIFWSADEASDATHSSYS